jgi:hypothetical protein
MPRVKARSNIYAALPILSCLIMASAIGLTWWRITQYTRPVVGRPQPPAKPVQFPEPQVPKIVEEKPATPPEEGEKKEPGEVAPTEGAEKKTQEGPAPAKGADKKKQDEGAAPAEGGETKNKGDAPAPAEGGAEKKKEGAAPPEGGAEAKK